MGMGGQGVDSEGEVSGPKSSTWLSAAGKEDAVI